MHELLYLSFVIFYYKLMCYSNKRLHKQDYKILMDFLENLYSKKSTAVEQVVACALVMQRARVRSSVGTKFLGEVFSGFFLTRKTNVGKL